MPVDSTSSTSSARGSTSASGVPGSVPSASSMMPAWSWPRSTSSSARIIPSDVSPRTLRRSSVTPFGSTAPGSATATVAPAPKFQAPQTIERGSPSPTSTCVNCNRSAFGCLTASRTVPTRNSSRFPFASETPRRSSPSTSADATEKRVASSASGISIGTYSRSQLIGTRIRTASARGGRPPRGRGCRECRAAAAPCARAHSRTRSRSRHRDPVRRSRRRAGRPCRRRPSRSSR